MKPKPSSIDISDSEDDLDSFPVTEIKPLGTSTKPAKGKKIGPKSRVQKKTTAKKDTKAKTTKAPKKANTEEEDIEEVELRSADNNDEAEKDGYVRSRMNTSMEIGDSMRALETSRIPCRKRKLYINTIPKESREHSTRSGL